jgi:hypothetical protein
MGNRRARSSAATPSAVLSNAHIADRLACLAQLLSTNKEGLYEITAYRRASSGIRSLPESLDELVRSGAGLRNLPGITDAIASAIRKIVLIGTLRKFETPRGEAAPEVGELAEYPRLDPKPVLRLYKKLKISSSKALLEKLQRGEIQTAPGRRTQKLNYTVCSIQSRFSLNLGQQSERLMRAMDNPYFMVLGHATGDLLLKRPGNGVEIDLTIGHAKTVGCFFEIRWSPDGSDLSTDHARLPTEADVKIAVWTDARSTREVGALQYEIDQARHGELEPAVLNRLSRAPLQPLFRG